MITEDLAKTKGCIVLYDTGQCTMYGGFGDLQGFIRMVNMNELAPCFHLLARHDPIGYCKSFDKVVVNVFWLKGHADRELLTNSYVPETAL